MIVDRVQHFRLAYEVGDPCEWFELLVVLVKIAMDRDAVIRRSNRGLASASPKSESWTLLNRHAPMTRIASAFL